MLSGSICLVHCVRSSTLLLQCLSVHAPLDRKPFLWLSRLFRNWAAQCLGCLSIGILPRVLGEASLQVEECNPKGEPMNFCGRLMLESGAMRLCSSASPSSHVTDLGCACCRRDPLASASLWRGADKRLPLCLYSLLVNFHSCLWPVPGITLHICLTLFLL